MTFNNSEYNSLRTELLHHDRSCLLIMSYLLTASTAIYGLASSEKFDSFLLILLSVIWLIGFLYIVEKRSNIKRISFYIRNKIERENPFAFKWEQWCFQNRNEQSGRSLPKISPLTIEFALLTATNIFNSIWLCVDSRSQIIKYLNNFLISLGINYINNHIKIILCILLLLIPLLSFIISSIQIFKYYNSDYYNLQPKL